jgi:ribosomal protein L40E
MGAQVKRPNVVFCSKCGFANPASNKFCFSCGGSLFTFTCSYCGVVNPHYAKFCGSCGRSLKVT